MKIALNLVVVLSLALSIPALALAQEPNEAADRPGVDLGVRIGYAIPFGNIDGNPGDGLNDVFSGAVPLILEAGYRFDSRFTLGALFQYAFAQVKDIMGCGTYGVSCSGSIIRLGIEGLYHFPTESRFVPWLGIGAGYEWMSIDLSGNGATASVGAHGFEFLTLQAGGDALVSKPFSLGPFVSFSLARYDTLTLDEGGTTMSNDIPNTTVHEWLQFGVRGTFKL